MADVQTPTLSEAMDMEQLRAALQAAPNYQAALQAIVDSPFEQKIASALLFLGFMTLLVVNEETGVLDRVALSKTELAHNTLDVSYVPFEDIKIPLDDPNNIVVKAIQTNESQHTDDWYDTFTPALTGDQARINQASGGIAYTAIYPVRVGAGMALSFSYYQYAENIGEKQKDFMTAYAEVVYDVFSKKYKF